MSEMKDKRYITFRRMDTGKASDAFETTLVPRAAQQQCTRIY